MKAKLLNFQTQREEGCQLFLSMQTPTYHNTLEWGRIEKIIDDLDEQFPDKFPDHTLSEKEISFRAGQLSIIRILKTKIKGE